jgi:hypothetical protein
MMVSDGCISYTVKCACEMIWQTKTLRNFEQSFEISCMVHKSHLPTNQLPPIMSNISSIKKFGLSCQTC